VERTVATGPHEVPAAHRAEAEAALEVLLDPALDPIVDMVCTVRDGVYEALAADGRRLFDVRLLPAAHDGAVRAAAPAA
jgi:hypothetical protein